MGRGCLNDNLDKLLAETPSERNQRPIYRSTLSEGLERLKTITYFGLSLSGSSSSSGFFPNLPSANSCSQLSHMNFPVGERVAVTSYDLHECESCLEFKVIDNFLSSLANIIDEDIVCLT